MVCDVTCVPPPPPPPAAYAAAVLFCLSEGDSRRTVGSQGPFYRQEVGSKAYTLALHAVYFLMSVMCEACLQRERERQRVCVVCVH